MTLLEIFTDIKTNKSSQLVQDWLSAHSVSLSNEELAQIKQQAQTQNFAINGLVGSDQGKTAAKLIQDSLSSPEWRYGRNAIPSYLAALATQASAPKGLDASLLPALKSFEQSLFAYLPELARLDIILKRLLTTINAINILAELQSTYAVEQYGDDGSWPTSYKQALLQNAEVLSDVQIVLDNAPVPATVGHWIQDFNTTLNSGLVGNPGTYDQVHYFNTSPLVAKLTTADKATLSLVLRLYSWLNDPSVNEEELVEYENNQVAVREQKLGLPKFEPVNKIVLQSSLVPARIEPDNSSGQRSSVNMQNILSRRGQGGGVVFDNQTNVPVEEIGQRLEAERQQKQSDIDKKLADLKKRRN